MPIRKIISETTTSTVKILSKYNLFNIKTLKEKSISFFKSPLALGLTYIGMIPLFAAIYTSIMPADFLHANIKSEKSFYVDLSNHRKKLSTLLKEYLLMIQHNDELKLKDVQVNDYYDDGEFTATLFLDKKNSKCLKTSATLYESMNEGSCPSEKIFFCFIKKYNRKDYYLYGYNMNCSGMKNVGIYALAELENYFKADEAFKKIANKTEVADTFFLAYPSIDHFLSAKSEQKFQLLLEFDLHESMNTGLQLKPSLMVFIRMMYFSIVTITTLGYGDISPVTNRARIAVGLESLLGIIVIGLFLNAITTKASSNTNHDKSKT